MHMFMLYSVISVGFSLRVRARQGVGATVVSALLHRALLSNNSSRSCQVQSHPNTLPAFFPPFTIIVILYTEVCYPCRYKEYRTIVLFHMIQSRESSCSSSKNNNDTVPPVASIRSRRPTIIIILLLSVIPCTPMLLHTSNIKLP